MATRQRGSPAAPATGHEVDPLAAALEEVGDRWTLLLVDALLAGPRRFGELQSEVPGIATNVLAKRLAQLEESSLVVATAYSARPPRFTYQLTEAGRELADALTLLRRWGAARAAGDDPVAAQPLHADCGSVLEPRWWCPICERVAEEDEPPDLRYV